jgi:hypothetical protein
VNAYSSGFRDAWAQTAQSVVEMNATVDRLQARVEALTAALTEIVDLHDRDLTFYGDMDTAWARARAVLSATPTESEKP